VKYARDAKQSYEMIKNHLTKQGLSVTNPHFSAIEMRLLERGYPVFHQQTLLHVDDADEVNLQTSDNTVDPVALLHDRLQECTKQLSSSELKIQKLEKDLEEARALHHDRQKCVDDAYSTQTAFHLLKMQHQETSDELQLLQRVYAQYREKMLAREEQFEACNQQQQLRIQELESQIRDYTHVSTQLIAVLTEQQKAVLAEYLEET
jgi:predicted  nucleic acid-binding Zn-ribbon protein